MYTINDHRHTDKSGLYDTHTHTHKKKVYAKLQVGACFFLFFVFQKKQKKQEVCHPLKAQSVNSSLVASNGKNDDCKQCEILVS